MFAACGLSRLVKHFLKSSAKRISETWDGHVEMAWELCRRHAAGKPSARIVVDLNSGVRLRCRPLFVVQVVI